MEIFIIALVLIIGAVCIYFVSNFYHKLQRKKVKQNIVKDTYESNYYYKPNNSNNKIRHNYYTPDTTKNDSYNPSNDITTGLLVSSMSNEVESTKSYHGNGGYFDGGGSTDSYSSSSSYDSSSSCSSSDSGGSCGCD